MDTDDLLNLSLGQLKNLYGVDNVVLVRGANSIRPLEGILFQFLSEDEDDMMVVTQHHGKDRCLACFINGEYVIPGELELGHAEQLGLKEEDIGWYNKQEKPVMTLEAELKGVKPKLNPFVPNIDRNLAYDVMEALMDQGELPIDYFKDYQEMSKSVGKLSPAFSVISVTEGPGRHTVYNVAALAFERMMKILPSYLRPRLMTDRTNFYWCAEFLSAFVLPTPYVHSTINHKVHKNEIMVSATRLGSGILYKMTKKRLKLKHVVVG